MAALELKIFTYWEGPKSALQDVCLGSIDAQVGSNSHEHLVADDLLDLPVPQHIRALRFAATRADWLRAYLLYERGGFWLDSDVLLLNDPFTAVGTKPKVWSQRATGGHYLINLAAVYAPIPGSPWLAEVLSVMEDPAWSPKNYMAGTRVFDQAYRNHRASVERGSWREFNSASSWAEWWDSPCMLYREDALGIHLWWSAVNKANPQLSRCQSENDLIELAPHSVLAEYITCQRG